MQFSISHVICMLFTCNSRVVRMSVVCSRIPLIYHTYVLICNGMSLGYTHIQFACHQYVLLYNDMSLLRTLMSSVGHSYVLVDYAYVISMYSCHSYVTCKWSYIICIYSYVMICHSHVLVFCPYVTRMYSHVTRMSLASICMLSVCHPHATCIYSCVIGMSLVCSSIQLYMNFYWLYSDYTTLRS